MINVFNGIIVDTFQSLRQEKEKKESFQKNVCFICELKRSQFEKEGYSYVDHIHNTHNIANYIHYFIRLGHTDEFELNSLESWVKKNLDGKKTDFFPFEFSIDLPKSLK